MSASGNEHCEPCAFTQLPVADTQDTILEERLVQEHLIALEQDKATNTPPELWRDLSARQKWAARQCAHTIMAGECPLFLSVPSLDRTQVRLLRRQSRSR